MCADSAAYLPVLSGAHLEDASVVPDPPSLPGSLNRFHHHQPPSLRIPYHHCTVVLQQPPSQMLP